MDEAVNVIIMAVIDDIDHNMLNVLYKINNSFPFQTLTGYQPYP